MASGLRTRMSGLSGLQIGQPGTERVSGGPGPPGTYPGGPGERDRLLDMCWGFLIPTIQHWADGTSHILNNMSSRKLAQAASRLLLLVMASGL